MVSSTPNTLKMKTKGRSEKEFGQDRDRELEEVMKRVFNESQNKEIASLKEEKLALQEELKADRRRITDLEVQVNDITKIKEDEAVQWQKRCALKEKERCQLVKEKETLTAKHQANLQKRSNVCNKELSEQIVKHQAAMTKLEADNRTVKEQVLALKRQHLLDKDVIAKLEASLRAAEEDKKNLMKSLQEETLQKEEALQKIGRKDNLSKINYTKHCNLKKDYAKLEERNDELKEMDALKKSSSSLEKAVKDLNKFIQNQKWEMSVLKNEINDHEKTAERKETAHALLELKLKNELTKGLEDKLKHAENKLKLKTEALDEVSKDKVSLNKKVSGHTSMVDGFKLERRQDKERIRALETHQQQSKKDLHGCFQFISDPHSFKKSLIAHKRRYLDDDSTAVVHNDDITTAAGIKKEAQAYRTQVRTEKLNQRDENRMMLKRKNQEDQNVSRYIDTINEQRREAKALGEQLKKVAKPAVKKV